MSEKFKDAVSFVSSSSIQTDSNTKLRLYALFKIATASTRPETTRPALWSIEGRAKWDAWDEKGLELGEVVNRQELVKKAEVEYVEVAKSLGFGAAHGGEKMERISSETSGGKGMVSVSKMAVEEMPEGSSTELHDLAIEGKADEIRQLLATSAGRARVNEKDSYGFTPLHLAVDRGHVQVAEVLLKEGADITMKDEDGNTALDLAMVLEDDKMINLLKEHAP
ncbi:ankyrin [Meredithblackwellia eburnea MCA 4105]